ncbi:MAG: TonB-dependent receptor [Rhizobiaceae bacterium]|nr:TonB-dependent receptor [Rhizobiaceae bacterium]
MAVLSFATAAHAQSVPAVNTVTAEDLEVSKNSNRSTTLLQRIIVGAGNEKIAIDTPQAVTVINQEDLDREGATTIGDALDEVPGVTAIGSDRIVGQSFNIRGVGSLGASDESKIIVTVDGATKFYEQYRMGSFFSDPELYKRIEILRGPASSTLYGSGAYGGVINMTTKDASDFLDEGQNGALRIKGAFDSNRDGYLGSAIYAVRLDEHSDFLFAGNYRQSAKYEDGDGNEIAGSEIDSNSFSLKGTRHFGMNDEQSMRLSYQRWQSTADDTEYSQTGTLGFGTIDREVTDETIIFSYENPASDNPYLNLKFNVSYSDTTVVQDDASLVGAFGNSALFRPSNYGYQTSAVKLENTFEKIGDDYENYLTIGAQYSRQIRTADTDNGPIGFHPEGEDTKLGLYVQNEFIFDEKLTIIPGVRVDFIDLVPDASIASASAISDTAFSPKIAAMYKFNENFSLFGSVAHTERVATLDEIFSSAAPNTTYPGGRLASLVLDKEESDNYEAGFTVSLFDVVSEGDSVQLKTTFFQNNLENLISTNPDTGNAAAVVYFVNIDKAQIEGVEVEAAYSSDEVFGSLAYSRIRGEDLTTGVGLNSIPADNLAFTIGKRIPDMNFEFGWRSQFYAFTKTGATDGLSGIAGPFSSYSTHGLFMSWKPDEPEYGGFELRASVENMFDEMYRHNLAGDNGKGRTFKLSLVKEFGW